jgi:hypothetical protein
LLLAHYSFVFEETLNTLKYANRVKKLKTRATRNLSQLPPRAADVGSFSRRPTKLQPGAGLGGAAGGAAAEEVTRLRAEVLQLRLRLAEAESITAAGRGGGGAEDGSAATQAAKDAAAAAADVKHAEAEAVMGAIRAQIAEAFGESEQLSRRLAMAMQRRDRCLSELQEAQKGRQVGASAAVTERRATLSNRATELQMAAEALSHQIFVSRQQAIALQAQLAAGELDDARALDGPQQQLLVLECEVESLRVKNAALVGESQRRAQVATQDEQLHFVIRNLRNELAKREHVIAQLLAPQSSAQAGGAAGAAASLGMHGMHGLLGMSGVGGGVGGDIRGGKGGGMSGGMGPTGSRFSFPRQSLGLSPDAAMRLAGVSRSRRATVEKTPHGLSPTMRRTDAAMRAALLPPAAPRASFNRKRRAKKRRWEPKSKPGSGKQDSWASGGSRFPQVKSSPTTRAPPPARDAPVWAMPPLVGQRKTIFASPRAAFSGRRAPPQARRSVPRAPVGRVAKPRPRRSDAPSAGGGMGVEALGGGSFGIVGTAW